MMKPKSYFRAHNVFASSPLKLASVLRLPWSSHPWWHGHWRGVWRPL